MNRLSIGEPSFGDKPDDVRVDRESRQQRVRAVLLTFCAPKIQYHGMNAWELAGKILRVLDEPEDDALAAGLLARRGQ